MKGNGLKLKKTRNRQYPTETITYAEYTDDLALLTNVIVNVCCVAARNFGLYMKSEFMF